MKTASSKGVSTIVMAVVVIIVIAGAAGAYYFATMNQSSNNSSTSNQSTSSSTSTATSHTEQSSASTQSSNTKLSSSATSSQSTASSQTLSSSTCTGTYTATTTGNALSIQAVLNLVSKLPSMTVRYYGTSSGSSSFNMTSMYKVISTSSAGGVTSYIINVTETVNATQEITAQAKVLSDGTVPWVYEKFGTYGYNTTSSASSIFVGVMTPFSEETYLQGFIQFYTGTQFTNQGISTATLGPTSMQVTTYVASDVNVSGCGFSSTITTFKMQVGTVNSINLVTFMHFSGSTTTNSMTTSTDFTIEVTSITKA